MKKSDSLKWANLVNKTLLMLDEVIDAHNFGTVWQDVPLVPTVEEQKHDPHWSEYIGCQGSYKTYEPEGKKVGIEHELAKALTDFGRGPIFGQLREGPNYYCSPPNSVAKAAIAFFKARCKEQGITNEWTYRALFGDKD